MAWILWLGGGVLLVIAEIFSLDLVLLMLAAGAFAGMGTALITDNVVIQAAVAMVVALGMLAVVRPGLAKRLHRGPELRLGTDKLIGERTVTPVELAAGRPGRIKVDGEEWSAVPYDESLVIAPGTRVEVLRIQGATAYVHPLSELD